MRRVFQFIFSRRAVAVVVFFTLTDRASTIPSNSDGMEREACVCDHGFDRSDLCTEIIIIIIIIVLD